MSEGSSAAAKPDHPSQSKKAISAVIWSSLNTLVPSVMAALTFLAASRVLGPNEFGLVALAGSIVLVSSAVAPVGFGMALVQTKNLIPDHLDSVFWLCATVAVFLYGVVFFLSSPIAEYLGEPAVAPLIKVMGLRVLLDMFAVVPDAVLIKSMQFGKVAIRSSVAAFASSTACLVLLYFDQGMWALALSQLTSAAAISIGSIFASGWRPRLVFTLKALKDLKAAGFALSGTRSIGLLNLDQLLIGGLLGTVALGLYGFSKRIFQILSDFMSGSLGNVSYSLFARLQDDEAKKQRAFLLAVSLSSQVAFPIFLGLASIAPVLVPLVFGQHWIEGVIPLQVFCLIGLFTCTGILQSSLINSQNGTGWWFRYSLAKQIVSIIFLLASYRFGVVGIICSALLVNCIFWPISARMTSRLLGVPVARYISRFGRPLLASTLMYAAVAEFMKFSEGLDPGIRIAAAIFVGLTVYVASMLVIARDELFNILIVLRQAIKH